MLKIELKEILKIFPYTEVKGLLGRKKKQELLNRQKAMPYTTNEGVVVLQHINATIQPGEFVVLLGPSGCGKTTLLRIIAGLEEPTLGDVLFDDVRVNTVMPEDRDIAMVFQNYSLYPHLTVYDNIAFTLRTQHVPREELHRTVTEMARLLGIEDYLQRLPAELSGGQLQRVGIARALVRKPKAFLMDEPFSNLDAQLRASLRKLVKSIHASLGSTFLYVTHDQTEALSLGQRILVMRDGLIVQDGTPAQIYNFPANIYVAETVGSPRMNFLENIPVKNGTLRLLGREISVPHIPEGTVTVGIRPVHILQGGGIPATVTYAEPLGSETIVHLTVGEQKLDALFETGQSPVFLRGQQIEIDFSPERLHFFDAQGNRIQS